MFDFLPRLLQPASKSELSDKFRIRILNREEYLLRLNTHHIVREKGLSDQLAAGQSRALDRIGTHPRKLSIWEDDKSELQETLRQKYANQQRTF